MKISKDEILKRRSKLSPIQREILEKRLRGEINSGSQLEVIPRRSQISPTPLSFAQQRLWFLHQLDPTSTAYNVSGFLRFTGSLNVTALEHSLNEIVQRHESLRTTFKMIEGQPVQIIAPFLSIVLPIVDLQKLPKNQLEQEIQRLTTKEAQVVFNLAQEPLLRPILLHLSKTEYLMQLTIHHIAIDGWSIGVFVRELTALYKAFCAGLPSPLPELPIQYADFALWQRQSLQGEKLESQITYWKKRLDSLPCLQLPTDRPRQAIQTFRAAKQYLMLPKALSEDIKALSQQEGVTLFMTLLATFQTLLHWYTSQDDIVVGTDIANRNQAEIEGLIGFFVNQLVLRTNLSENPSFRELLERVREVTLGAYTHQELPFDKVVDALKVERNLNRMPLFQVKFVFDNIALPLLELTNLTASTLNHLDTEETTLDLFLRMVDTEQGIKADLEYDIALFDASSIIKMLKNFEILLNTVIKQPEIRLNELVENLAKVEKKQLTDIKIRRKKEYSNLLKDVQRKAIMTIN
ncbi:condensation protein [Nostoc sp. 'Peltigera membranacea cyanobiont' 213]|nr:condensation protein [Nostoc sp. 'Peltigera membranacea cyanobiont' 213]